MATLQPGDALLVEGHSRFSITIEYLTQSTWSHADEITPVSSCAVARLIHRYDLRNVWDLVQRHRKHHAAATG